ncbi:MAG: glutamine--fructose-6-phosphate transaminase (isomerizing) [Corallococcus sp.]|nr:glutamine--fructose-6-phosphate transaminase (isomerizing) [Bacillota bacterium]MCM1533625.1 glutamine--fructose-6-phosphate transaminase (isomerizing) [Corallococcus sp.]
MCGIFGMIGDNAVGNTRRALKYLEYRGYDSAGIAVKDKNEIKLIKRAGRVEQLDSCISDSFTGQIAIGHTRWATHGKVCAENAHPFYSEDRKFAVVHNGIIENYLDIKRRLMSYGAKFTSETDSETAAYLLQSYYSGNVLDAVKNVAKELTGSFAIVIANAYDDSIYAIKNKSPLVVGISDDGTYLCSDTRCLSRWADKVALTPDNTIAVANRNGVVFYDFDGNPVSVKFFTPDKAEQIDEADGDFMLKEIMEIPQKVAQAKKNYFESGGINLPAKTVHRIKRIYLIGCGTAYNSGLQAAAVSREMLDVDVVPVIASEFIYDRYPVDSSTLAFFISQSGETADTIRAAEKVSKQGGFTYAVTNTDASSLCFVCDRVKNICAGGEFAVASTKAYNCQLVTLTLLLTDLAYLKGSIDETTRNKIADSLDALPNVIEKILDNSYEIVRLADEVKDCSAVFYIGRASDYPTACEGSLKLKEISYIHSEAYPAGELKHGTLALMEKGVFVVALATDSALLDKTASSVSEVVARGAEAIVVTPYGFKGANVVKIPVVNRMLYGIISVVPLQLLAYYVAKRLGRDVDKPRNLAKSVTVE